MTIEYLPCAACTNSIGDLRVNWSRRIEAALFVLSFPQCRHQPRLRTKPRPSHPTPSRLSKDQSYQTTNLDSAAAEWGGTRFWTSLFLFLSFFLRQGRGLLVSRRWLRPTPTCTSCTTVSESQDTQTRIQNKKENIEHSLFHPFISSWCRPPESHILLPLPAAF